MSDRARGEDAHLAISSLNTYYGNTQVLYNLSLGFQESEITAILGRNGMGKTTLLRSIMGLTPPKTGSISLEGEEISGLPPHEIYKRGISLVPEDRVIYPNLSVHENLSLPYQSHESSGEAQFEAVDVYQMFPAIEQRREEPGYALSGGQQQMLAIGRALIGNPDVLLLDEPFEGLAPKIIESIVDTIEELTTEDLTIIMVGQDISSVLALADYCNILVNGKVAFEGDPDEITDDVKVDLLGV